MGWLAWAAYVLVGLLIGYFVGRVTAEYYNAKADEFGIWCLVAATGLWALLFWPLVVLVWLLALTTRAIIRPR